jgi:leucyl aminopeptidase (aminopeptidase T)
LAAGLDRVERYAELIVRVGANVQPGQLVEVIARIEHAHVARAITWTAMRVDAT